MKNRMNNKFCKLSAVALTAAVMAFGMSCKNNPNCHHSVQIPQVALLLSTSDYQRNAGNLFPQYPNCGNSRMAVSKDIGANVTNMQRLKVENIWNPPICRLPMFKHWTISTGRISPPLHCSVIRPLKRWTTKF